MLLVNVCNSRKLIFSKTKKIVTVLIVVMVVIVKVLVVMAVVVAMAVTMVACLLWSF
jgi:hypothetical protein